MAADGVELAPRYFDIDPEILRPFAESRNEVDEDHHEHKVVEVAAAAAAGGGAAPARKSTDLDPRLVALAQVGGIDGLLARLRVDEKTGISADDKSLRERREQ